MELEIRGGRVFDLENEADVNRLGLAFLSLEDRLAMAVAHAEKMHKMMEQMMAKPMPEMPHTDMNPVVDALRELKDAMESGHRRIVMAQLAETKIVRDPVTGDAERSVKIING